jgi:hypothetical protein
MFSNSAVNRNFIFTFVLGARERGRLEGRPQAAGYGAVLRDAVLRTAPQDEVRETKDQSSPHISCAGRRTRNTTKCDIEKFTTKPARMATPFAARTGMNLAAKTRTVVLAMAPSTPDATKVP